MKKLIVISLLLISTFAKAQNNFDVLPQQNGKVVFSRTDVMNASKETLFDLGKKWMVKDSSTIFEKADTSTGRIIGNGNFVLNLNGGGFINDNYHFNFKVLVACTDNHYSITIDTITYTSSAAGAKPSALETRVTTSKANANVINMEFEKIYFSLMDAMTNGRNISPGFSEAPSKVTKAVDNPPPAPQPPAFTLPEIDGQVVYESIVDIPGKNKDFIYFNAGKWLHDIPNGVRAQIQTQDQSIGEIVAHSSFIFTDIKGSPDGPYNFQIQIDCKDNKYRIRLYEIIFHSDSWTITMEDANKYLKDSKAKPRHERAADVDSIFRGIVSSLKDAITKAANDDF